MNVSTKRLLSGIIPLFGVLLVALSSVLYAREVIQGNNYQDIATITKAALDYVQTHIPPAYQIQNLQTRSLDSRLRFSRCAQKLHSSVPGRFIPSDRMMITVSCPQPRWKIQVFVRARILKPVVVARSTLIRGETISVAQLEKTLMPVKTTDGQNFDSIKAVAGRVARRTIRAGKAIRANWLQIPYLVKRKQEVLIIARNPHLQVKVKGIALSNGKYNDQIRVKNMRSNKIIKARVSAQGEVSVNF